ncbi:hypothetical protein G3I32_21705 [Streptomyces coelicoflavus]|uniref:Uncharacterized protein n=1 Tax=Streptomyces coelicoflavus TaxID=285562 RepID=A0A7K3PN85_9ACTN|nr:hypothetical protein [Streptomyces coelicoflavus]NEB11424.1 hypothetical protein [Streptomyces coelicoflavus]
MTTDATRRPRSVTLAVVLLMLGALVAATTATGPQGPATLVLLLLAVCFWFAVRAGRGRRTARTAASGLTAALLVVAAPFALDDPLYGGTTLLVAALLAVPGVVLLYRPAAEAYVRARSGDDDVEYGE